MLNPDETNFARPISLASFRLVIDRMYSRKDEARGVVRDLHVADGRNREVAAATTAIPTPTKIWPPNSPTSSRGWRRSPMSPVFQPGTGGPEEVRTRLSRLWRTGVRVRCAESRDSHRSIVNGQSPRARGQGLMASEMSLVNQ